MTVEAIRARCANETALHETAVKIREILDKAVKVIPRDDERDVEEEFLELVTGD